MSGDRAIKVRLKNLRIKEQDFSFDLYYDSFNDYFFEIHFENIFERICIQK